jgi:predicted histone-like DNA-binding protein
MSVKYNVVEHGNPANPAAPKKFYPSIVSSGRLTARELAVEAASMSTLSSADLAAALEIFLTIIPKELAKGNIVELGDFGSFWLKANADGVETAEAARATQINTLLPRFNPGKEFKKVLATVEYEKA